MQVEAFRLVPNPGSISSYCEVIITAQLVAEASPVSLTLQQG